VPSGAEQVQACPMGQCRYRGVLNRKSNPGVCSAGQGRSREMYKGTVKVRNLRTHMNRDGQECTQAKRTGLGVSLRGQGRYRCVNRQLNLSWGNYSGAGKVQGGRARLGSKWCVNIMLILIDRESCGGTDEKTAVVPESISL
jgi:hypothetical protein